MPLRLPSARTMMLLAGKAVEPPEGGWTAESFARDGRRLIFGIHRLAKIVQRRNIGTLARASNQVFRRQLDRVIELATRQVRAVNRHRGKQESIELMFPDHEILWMQALQQVFEEESVDTEIVTELRPPIQSTMAQGYNRVSMFLGQEADAGQNARIAREAQAVASRITGINGTTRELFERTIRGAINDGLTVQETTRLLREKLPAINANRQLTIARTELNRAWTQGAVTSYQESRSVTHVSVIGCEAREATAPRYQGQITCNIQDVPVEDAHLLEFHPNHTGNLVPSRFRRADGTVVGGDEDRPRELEEPPAGEYVPE